MAQPQAEVLLAIEQAKTELTKLIADSTAGIQLTVSHMQRQHDQAILDQAKLNATFTNRDETTGLVRRVDGHEAQIHNLNNLLAESAADRKDIHRLIAQLTESAAKQQNRTLQQQINWLVSGAVAAAAAIAGYGAHHFLP